MEKRQQWTVVAVAVLISVALGAIVYRQFLTVPALVPSEGSPVGTELKRVSETPATPAAANIDPVPAGKASPDEVAKGIAADLSTEESTATNAETTTEKGTATNSAAALNDYGNAYDDSKL